MAWNGYKDVKNTRALLEWLMDIEAITAMNKTAGIES